MCAVLVHRLHRPVTHKHEVKEISTIYNPVYVTETFHPCEYDQEEEEWVATAMAEKYGLVG